MAGETTKKPASSGASIVSIVSARRGEKRRAVTRTLAAVRGAYLETSRDRILADKLEAFLDLVLGEDDAGRRQDGRIFFLTGESGAGKSRAIRRYLEKSTALAPIERDGVTLTPAVSVKGPSPSTLRRLGVRICREAGYPLKTDVTESRVWEILGDQLRLRQILLVHVDEAQHLVRHMNSEVERTNVANALKDVVENRQWPVSFILSGMPVSTEIGRLDRQIERRSFMMHFQSLDLDHVSDRKIVEDILGYLAADVAGLHVDRLLREEFLDRLAHAAAYQIGRIAQVVAQAIHVALLADQASLEVGHFSIAYRASSHAEGLDDHNPFVARDWRSLRPGSFIIPKDGDEDDF